MPKALTVLKFPEVATHFSPKIQSSILPSRSLSKNFYSYKDTPWKNLWFSLLCHNPDRPVKRKLPLVLKKLDFQLLHFSITTCSISAIKVSIGRFQIAAIHSVSNCDNPFGFKLRQSIPMKNCVISSFHQNPASPKNCYKL